MPHVKSYMVFINLKLIPYKQHILKAALNEEL